MYLKLYKISNNGNHNSISGYAGTYGSGSIDGILVGGVRGAVAGLVVDGGSVIPGVITGDAAGALGGCVQSMYSYYIDCYNVDKPTECSDGNCGGW